MAKLETDCSEERLRTYPCLIHHDRAVNNHENQTCVRLYGFSLLVNSNLASLRIHLQLLQAEAKRYLL